MSKLLTFLWQVAIDTLKEKQSDGELKWSWLRICGFIWFWVADIGSLIMYFFKSVPISPELSILTGVILLGVVGGKATNIINSVVSNSKI